MVERGFMHSPRAAARTILIVEDDTLIQDILVPELRDAGFNVVVAGTGEDALAILQDRRHTIDWLFTDIRLPGVIDGWRVADEFRFSHPLRPVVYASAFPSEQPRPVAHSIFIRKPYRPSEIVEAFVRLSEGAADASA
jgi:two-component system OmpR family response regulator